LKNIFISRPTTIDKKFHKGLDNALNFLEQNDFKTRTLGSSDYPSESPLNEVLRIMKECKGIIVLGYPQIIIKSGYNKSKKITDEVILATEWNHIEAALAYSLSLPMLVIHHIGISRGIFDRGTLNSFIYEIDLANDSWIFEKNIIGAFNTWKQKLIGSPSSVKPVQDPISDFILHRGLHFRKKKDGKIEDTVYCPKCNSPMFSMEDFFPYICSICGLVSGFNRSELRKIISEIKI